MFEESLRAEVVTTGAVHWLCGVRVGAIQDHAGCSSAVDARFPGLSFASSGFPNMFARDLDLGGQAPTFHDIAEDMVEKHSEAAVARVCREGAKVRAYMDGRRMEVVADGLPLCSWPSTARLCHFFTRSEVVFGVGLARWPDGPPQSGVAHEFGLIPVSGAGGAADEDKTGEKAVNSGSPRSDMVRGWDDFRETHRIAQTS